MTQLDSDAMTPEGRASVRSALYRLVGHSFNFPTLDFYKTVESGEFFATIRSILNALPHLESAQSLEDKLSDVTADFEEFCAEYLRLFDVGSRRGKPPCPLYGGEYGIRPRLDVMEELVRFYGFFDLALSQQDRELPDHLSVELEFLHYLAFREGDALARCADPSSYQRAQADFIERHAGQWLPIMQGKLETQTPLPFFAELVSLTTDLLRADLGYLRSTLRRPQECATK
ncbi:MAG: molecular chaperone TorD family protein [Candidatus Binatus sp.]|jgi:DMSO reductase family type II enzyme chaperone